MTKTIKIIIPKVHNFRKIYESELTGSMYGATCPILSIYSLKDQLDAIIEINPRNQKYTSAPSKAMQETLRDSQDFFVFRNRGITFVAHDAIWDNKTENLEMTFEINDALSDQINGLADGGHTYDVIKNFVGETEEAEQKEITAEVRLDIITGFDENVDEIAEIVEARNTSTQVRTESLLNYRGVFDSVKDSIKNQEYSDNVAYYENQYVDDKNPTLGYRSISVNSLLSYLMCFDVKTFDQNNHPIVAYSSKKKVIDWFSNRLDKDHKNTIAFCKILPEILDLRDYIESQIPEIWNRVSTRFGNQPGVKKTKNEKKLDFSEYMVGYNIPGGFVYPILSAFRSLLIETKDGYKFKTDPKKLFDLMNSEEGKTLIYKLINVDNKDPQKIGKSSGLYDSCYGSLMGYYYESIK
jgi:hypothetical protein